MELDLRQAQSVTPQMITTMTILQYGAQELTEYLSELSYENPMLELQDPAPEKSVDTTLEKLRWLRQSDQQNRSYYPDEEDRSVQLPAAVAETLEDYLREQLLALTISQELRSATQVLIALLDEHGFFTGSLYEAAQLAQCSGSTAQKALELLRSLEPVGVGTANVRECLLLQLRHLDRDTALARRILEEQYPLLQSPARLSAALKASPEAVAQALRQISALNPYPADGFAASEAPIYIQPDLYILKEQDALTVQCREEALPQVHISRQYLHMLETEQDPAVQKYLREKLRQVEQVLHDLGNRKSTMLRCGELLARHQQAFFQGGSLKKLTLRDAAQELEVHESTVSRTVKDKYIQCDRGLFPMSYFFSRSAGQNPNLCRNNIQEALSQVIAAEDTRHPLSDQQLVSLLSKEHIIISRRTVAKYRAELGILPASARRCAGL
jgi:RNA polymerase sigma-54 factor